MAIHRISKPTAASVKAGGITPEVDASNSPRQFFPPMTSAPVRPGDFPGVQPEFGRWRDAEHLFGIKRGSLYGLLEEGKIKGVLLRIRGSKSGIRLFDLQSIRDYIELCRQAEQEAA